MESGDREDQVPNKPSTVISIREISPARLSEIATTTNLESVAQKRFAIYLIVVLGAFNGISRSAPNGISAKKNV